MGGTTLNAEMLFSNPMNANVWLGPANLTLQVCKSDKRFYHEKNDSYTCGDGAIDPLEAFYSRENKDFVTGEPLKMMPGAGNYSFKDQTLTLTNGPVTSELSELTHDALSMFTTTANADGTVDLLFGEPDWDNKTMIERGVKVHMRNQQSCIGMSMLLGGAKMGGS